MPLNRKLIKVFLGSPGDLKEERKIAKSVIDEINSDWADFFTYLFELVGWEGTVSGTGRPQAIINRELEQCEVFVGMMWRKWGTPPDRGGAYSSGFEEEFRTSFDRFKREQKPEISLLFKDVTEDHLVDPGEDLKRVLAFREEIIAGKEIYFETFADVREFERKFRRLLHKYIKRLSQEDAAAPSSARTHTPETEHADSGTASADSNVNSPQLAPEAGAFLRQFISRYEKGRREPDINATELARFRLLGTALRNDRNDDVALGVHDANLLFEARTQISFSTSERGALLTAALDHYDAENVPLWHWLAVQGGFERRILPFYAVINTDKRAQNAIAAMRLISEPLNDAKVNRETFIKWWFVKPASEAVRKAALGYLGEYGTSIDLPVIREELQRGSAQTSSAAVDAIVRIVLRDSRESAVRELFELQPSSIDAVLVGEIFGKGEGLSDDLLTSGVSHSSAAVRAAVVRILRGRGALQSEIAEQLLADSDADVRYEALIALVESGRTFSDQEVKKILVPAPRRSGLGGALFRASYDAGGEALVQRFKLNRLRTLKKGALQEIALQSSIYDQDAWFLLCERYFAQYAGELRQLIDDGFTTKVSQALGRDKEEAGARNLLPVTPDVEEYIRKKLLTKAIGVLSRRGNRSDLQRVRSAMSGESIGFSAAAVEFLASHGEWRDIDRIIGFLGSVDLDSPFSILTAMNDSKYMVGARAIYALGKSRVPELLSIKASGELLVRLLAHIPVAAFRNVDDGTLLGLFNADDATVRRTATLCCMRALPRRRVVKLLADYVSGTKTHYYNVIHWLDMGASLPSVRAARAAQKALTTERRS